MENNSAAHILEEIDPDRLEEHDENDSWARLVTVLALAGCATQVAEYRHPTTGDTKGCVNGRVELIYGANAVPMAGTYAGCKSALEDAGYRRVPIDAVGQKVIDETDAARAASVRKQ